MMNGKTYYLSPKTEENTEFDKSDSTTKQFKVLRKRIDETGATLQAQITVNADAIALKASQSSLNALGDRVTTAEATLIVQADQITTRVATTDYNGNEIASLINQTATTIQISASRINLSGYATFTALSTSGATTINGDNITTGTLNAGRINVTNLNASNITGGTLSADRVVAGYLSAGTIGGWNIGGSTISRSGITLGSDYISFSNQGTGGSTINMGSAKIYNQGGNTIAISGALYASGGLRVDGQTTSNSILPSSNNTYSLGTGSFRWATIYQTNGAVTGSDKVLKKDIEDIVEATNLVKLLKPRRYKMKDGSSNRPHYGYIAQEVKQALDELGLDSGVYIDPVVKEVPENGAGYAKGLRYEEFIALNTAVIQHLLNRVEVLENELHSRTL